MARYSLKTLRVSNCKLNSRCVCSSLAIEDDAAGVAVEPMDDARPIVAAGFAQFAEVKRQRIDERARPVSLGGMDHHVERLVDDGEILVLVENVEREYLRAPDRGGAARGARCDAVADTHLEARLDRRVIQEHAFGLDGLLQQRAAEIGEQAGKILVKTSAGGFLLDDEIDRSADSRR